MGEEKQINLNNSDDAELTLVEESEDTIKEGLDENDSLLPLKEVGGESLAPSEKDNFTETKGQTEEEIEMPLVKSDDQMENSPAVSEAEISLTDNDEQSEEESASNVWVDDLSNENDDPVEADLDTSGSDQDDLALSAEDRTDTDEPNEDLDADEENQETKTPADGDNSDIKSRLEEKFPTKPLYANNANVSESPKNVNRSSPINKIISLALIMLIGAGFILYYNPSLIGLTKAEQPATPAPEAPTEPVTPVAQQVTTPLPPSKRDQCMAKIEEAVGLRNELLEKKIEISDLDLNYRNGIAELEEEIYQEIKKEGISTYEEAMKNKRLELSMRTIQRRQTYIKELAKPAYWLNTGSEELLYLIRKAKLDLQLTEIAGGVELNKHMRHIGAAIQKYRPSSKKLAVDPLGSKVQALEKIWQQVSNRKDKKEQISLNSKDEIIINQICSGNFEHISELTRITHGAARCLSLMKGADLFLNGLTTLSPDAAEQLFKWQGNWICLNGVKQLSPAVAQYLFNWKGNWISLNSLIEFPPELAMFLLKWEGQQIELMGLKYIRNETTQKTLKYLALWETTGGKLFVTDKIRQEMLSLM